jgi:hypothetical protein
MSNFPSGTVTFLFTDIEETTKMARVNPETWKSLGPRHHQILREVIESKNGFVFQRLRILRCVSHSGRCS